MSVPSISEMTSAIVEGGALASAIDCPPLINNEPQTPNRRINASRIYLGILASSSTSAFRVHR
jgi:hypothetical protein